MFLVLPKKIFEPVVPLSKDISLNPIGEFPLVSVATSTPLSQRLKSFSLYFTANLK